MGICQLSPQQRVITKKNASLIVLLSKQLQDLTIYYFCKPLSETIKTELLPRYMITDIMVQDIYKLHSNVSPVSQSMNRSALDDTYQQDLRQSCIIMQDQQAQISNMPQSHDPSKSFKQNLKNNQSLLLQIKILYSKQIDHTIYNSSLRLFLKWVQLFHEHAYGGFMKPLYKKFCESVYKMDRTDFQTIIDEVTVFVDFMIKIYTYVYALKKLNAREDGKLFKHQNIYNMIMSYIFRRTKIKIFLRQVIRINFSEQLTKFTKKLSEKQRISMNQLGIPIKFSLVTEQIIMEESSSSYQSNQFILSSLREEQQNVQVQDEQTKLILNQQNSKILNGPYIECIKLVDQLCNKQDTPITKLKHLVKIAKTIIKSIENYYQARNKQIPELDSDSLTSIIMYIIIKANNNRLLQQLKIIENFTTMNCLNSISGYYLQSFLAAAQMIIQM